jgi:hypothetical protein
MQFGFRVKNNKTKITTNAEFKEYYMVTKRNPVGKNFLGI